MPEALKISGKDFLEIVAPALGHCSKADAMAILKRSVFLVFGKKFFYYRTPGSECKDVHRLRRAKDDIVKTSSKPVLAAFKEGIAGPPADFESKVAYETQWLQEAARKRSAGRAAGSGSAPAAPPPPIK
eukprot:8387196-Alexandrium_andersonii.AAC.1